MTWGRLLVTYQTLVLNLIGKTSIIPVELLNYS